jgi:hypothetical protein
MNVAALFAATLKPKEVEWFKNQKKLRGVFLDTPILELLLLLIRQMRQNQSWEMNPNFCILQIFINSHILLTITNEIGQVSLKYVGQNWPGLTGLQAPQNLVGGGQ